MTIFSNEFHYTAYVDDTTYFLNNKNSVFETLNILNKFSLVSGLSPNTTKCEIFGIGTLKEVNVALCGKKCLNLTRETVKILGVHLSYNKKLKYEMNFQSIIVRTEGVLRLWRMENLTRSKSFTFKSLAISKIVHLPVIITVSHAIINQLNNIQKNFTWNGKNPKIKHSALLNSYEDDGLKDFDVFTKIVSLRCSWIKRLYDENFNDWKIIPL